MGANVTTPTNAVPSVTCQLLVTLPATTGAKPADARTWSARPLSAKILVSMARRARMEGCMRQAKVNGLSKHDSLSSNEGLDINVEPSGQGALARLQGRLGVELPPNVRNRTLVIPAAGTLLRLQHRRKQ
jgi:hypothetical protein